MAVTEGKLGFGALLKRGDAASPEVFTTIAEVFDIGEVGETLPLVQMTHHESPDKTHEYITGLKDGDEFSVQANYLPANATQDQTTGIISVFKNGDKDNYQLVAPDGDITLSMALIVLHWGIVFNLEDRQVLSVNFKVSGAITLA